jgi:hypothetical protein
LVWNGIHAYGSRINNFPRVISPTGTYFVFTTFFYGMPLGETVEQMDRRTLTIIHTDKTYMTMAMLSFRM